MINMESPKVISLNVYDKIAEKLKPLEDSQKIQVNQVEANFCAPCEDNFQRKECEGTFLAKFGIQTKPYPENPDFRVLTAPNGVIINTDAADAAFKRFESQLPTGSLTGYFTQIFTNIGNSLASNAVYNLGVILAAIIIFSFILFVMTVLIFISNSLITTFTGITLIFIALFFAFVVLIISYYEARKFGNNIEVDFTSQIEPVLKVLNCAFYSGICAGAGLKCCCPGFE